MEQTPPSGEADTTDRVAQNGEALHHGPSPVRHDGDVRFPIQGAGDEDAEVPHLVLGLHLRVTAEGISVGSNEGRRPDDVRRGTGGTEEHKFRFVRVHAKAVVGKPTQNVVETGDGRVETGPDRGTRTEDGTVINIQVDRFVPPSGIESAEHDGGVDSGEDG
jgi:hypothetical protein